MQLVRSVSEKLVQAIIDSDYDAFTRPINTAPTNRLRQQYCDIEGIGRPLVRLTGISKIADFPTTAERVTIQKLVHSCLHADSIQMDLIKAFDNSDFPKFETIINELPDERTRQMFCHFEAGLIWQPSPLAQMCDEDSRTRGRMQIFNLIQVYIAEGLQEYHSRRGQSGNGPFLPRGRPDLRLVRSL